MKTLVTERLILRKWNESDLNDFYEYAKNPNVGPSAGWQPHNDFDVSMQILKSFIAKDDVWAITEKRSGKVIGSYGLHADRKRDNAKARMIGYVLSEQYWGKGLMTEATKKVLEFAFEELDLEIISVYHYPFNARSKRVIEKCGFKFEGVLKLASTIYDGSVYDDVCYAMTKMDYFINLT